MDSHIFQIRTALMHTHVALLFLRALVMQTFCSRINEGIYFTSLYFHVFYSTRENKNLAKISTYTESTMTT